MQNIRKHITVFEHQAIKLNQEIDGVKFDEQTLKTLQNYYGTNGVPFFSLLHNGIRFNEHVGVIQVRDLIIEVLPKVDKSFEGGNEKKQWRNILIDMLFAINKFKIHAPTCSYLKLKPNSILDLYFELFIIEVEYLLHNGLLKQYRKQEGNLTTLKGALQFGKHIQHNVTHQERFYVRHISYDFEHKLHLILYKTIRLLRQININTELHSRIGALLLHFPEMPEIKITEAIFNQIVFTRKTQSYKRAIHISKLLLMNFHPDLNKGRNNVLALMFDMNKLWERFVFMSLYKHKQPNITVTAQTSRYFWKHKNGFRSELRPDIIINKDKDNCVVLDTKWKMLNGYNPSPGDLRQMFVYHEYFNAKRVALIYPGQATSKLYGAYLDPKTSKELDKECSLISISIEQKIKVWQKNIYNDLAKWLDLL